MSSAIFCKSLQDNIAMALKEHENARNLGHRGLEGRAREIAIGNLFAPLIPPGVEIVTGQISDSHGMLSPQIDVVIYDRNVLPAVILSTSEGVFP